MDKKALSEHDICTPADTEQHTAFDEIRQGLEHLDAVIASANDEAALLGFARAA